MSFQNDYPVSLLTYLVALTQDDVIARKILADDYTFGSYFAALIQAVKIGESDSLSTTSTLIRKVIKGFVPEEIEVDAAADERTVRMMKLLDSMRAQFDAQITTIYITEFFFGISVYKALVNRDTKIEKSVTNLRKIAELMLSSGMTKMLGRVSAYDVNIRYLGDLLKLTTEDKHLLQVAILFSTDIRSIIFRDYFLQGLLSPVVVEYFYMLMVSLDAPDVRHESVSSAFSPRNPLISMGVINYNPKKKQLSQLTEFWTYALIQFADDRQTFFSRFVTKLNQKESKKNFSGAIAKASSQEDEDLLVEYLGRATEETSEDGGNLGHNVLMYGPGSLDKMTYVKNIAKRLGPAGAGVFEIKADNCQASDVPGICLVAQRYIQDEYDGFKNLLVVEKAEQALTRRRTLPFWLSEDMVYDDETVNEEDLNSDETLLLKNPVTTIWLLNRTGTITTENVGRFSLHCQLRGGSRSDRRLEVQMVCDELSFSPEVVQHLSTYLELNSEQVKSAARVTKFLKRDGAAGEKLLTHVIKNSQKALNRDSREKIRSTVTKYDLRFLNVRGVAQPLRIIEALKKTRTGTLAFYGLPGTGKTALVEWMALELDMPLIIKPASELLDKYIGETEKRIAQMFEQATDEEALLLLDEGDSFLRDRSLAKQSWEITQVNELLQQMERFKGIFVVATNLFEALDVAALRRFTFKLQFNAMTPQQRLDMLIHETDLDISKLSDKERQDLEDDVTLIHHLTPGDFATVRRQCNIFGIEMSTAEWIDALRQEAAAKLVGINRNNYTAEAA